MQWWTYVVTKVLLRVENGQNVDIFSLSAIHPIYNIDRERLSFISFLPVGEGVKAFNL